MKGIEWLYQQTMKSKGNVVPQKKAYPTGTHMSEEDYRKLEKPPNLL